MNHILIYSPSQRSTVWNMSVLVTPYASAAWRNWDTCSICLKAIGELWILFMGLSPSWRLLMSSLRIWKTPGRLLNECWTGVKRSHDGFYTIDNGVWASSVTLGWNSSILHLKNLTDDWFADVWLRRQVTSGRGREQGQQFLFWPWFAIELNS